MCDMICDVVSLNSSSLKLSSIPPTAIFNFLLPDAAEDPFIRF